jgi:hypothetical protein
MFKPKLSRRVTTAFAGVSLAAVGAAASLSFAGSAGADVKHVNFQMVRSTASVNAGCLLNAKASVSIQSQGPVETMTIKASHLPHKTDFDLFVTQVPNAPFGVSWYQGDLQSDSSGNAEGTFVGRFNVETFAVAPGVAPAPVVFNNAFPDASENPAFNPIQMYHLGLWFNSPAAAAKAHCANVTTPFNGTHNAGPQAFSTQNFPDNAGPLRNLS